MVFTPNKINLFLFLKLPSAYWCGVRLISIDHQKCIVSVKHRWINQNPFRSMYFAVQSMAAELSTGALVMHYIKTNHIKAAMLVTGNKAIFSKKATGRITFACADVNLVEKAFQNAISTGESQIIWMKSIGTNEKNEIISVMDFEWSIKIK